MSQEIKRVSVTCRKTDCINVNYTLVLNDPGDTIVCGPCGTELIPEALS